MTTHARWLLKVRVIHVHTEYSVKRCDAACQNQALLADRGFCVIILLNKRVYLAFKSYMFLSHKNIKAIRISHVTVCDILQNH